MCYNKYMKQLINKTPSKIGSYLTLACSISSGVGFLSPFLAPAVQMRSSLLLHIWAKWPIGTTFTKTEKGWNGAQTVEYKYLLYIGHTVQKATNNIKSVTLPVISVAAEQYLFHCLSPEDSLLYILGENSQTFVKEERKPSILPLAPSHGSLTPYSVHSNT